MAMRLSLQLFRFHVQSRKSLLPARLYVHKRHVKSRFFVGCHTVPVLLSCNMYTITENQKELSGQISIHSKSHIQKACYSSIDSINQLLKAVGEAILKTGFQYKTSLNKLISLLQEYETLQSYSVTNEDTEYAIIAARVEIAECRKEFIELITIIENFEKLATETSKVSFLMSLESAALSISERMSNVRNIVESELAEIRSIEKNILKIERNLIQNRLKE